MLVSFRSRRVSFGLAPSNPSGQRTWLSRGAVVSVEIVGLDFQPFRINDLKLVTLAFAGWNQMVAWLRRLGALRQAV